MKIVCRKFTLFALTFLTVLAGFFLYAKTSLAATASEEDTKQYIYDNYGLFTDNEINDLTDTCVKYSEKAKADIIIITAGDLGGKTSTEYMEDFYDEKGFGYDKEFGDTVMMLIDMEEGNHNVWIQGYGKAEYYVNDDRIEHMLDDVAPLLGDGDFKKACIEFAKESAYYMNEEKGVKETPASSTDSYSGSNNGNYNGNSSYNGPSNYYGQKNQNPLYNTFVQLGIALVIGAASVAVMAVNSGGRMTVQGKDYLDNNNSGIIESRDDYLRTTTTRVKKPTPQENSGGGPRSSGGGGISSGGHSHSGGGRSF